MDTLVGSHGKRYKLKNTHPTDINRKQLMTHPLRLQAMELNQVSASSSAGQEAKHQGPQSTPKIGGFLLQNYPQFQNHMLVRESPQNPLNSGLGIILICPDCCFTCNKKTVRPGTPKKAIKP